jgi:hypothetical protein
MKTILSTSIFLLSALVSTSALAKNSHLTCETVDIGELDIKIEDQADGKEKLSVILTALDGVTVRTYVNTNFMNQSASQGLKDGKIQAIVSKTNLVASFGGAFLDAGVLELNRNKETQENNVIFAAEGLVYVASCTER